MLQRATLLGWQDFLLYNILLLTFPVSLSFKKVSDTDHVSSLTKTYFREGICLVILL